MVNLLAKFGTRVTQILCVDFSEKRIIPNKCCANTVCTFAVSAKNFEYDNLYITYFIELPECKF